MLLADVILHGTSADYQRYARVAVLLPLAAALLISVVTDLRSRLIYNKVTLPALTLVLALTALGNWPDIPTWALWGIAICAGPLLLAALPGWIGMGDVKLMAVVGAALGIQQGLAALFWITVMGGVQAVLQLLVARLRGTARPKYVPYACAIAAGTAAALLWGIPT